MANRLTKKDIEDVRGLLTIYRESSAVVSRLEKKLKVEIADVSEWGELLAGIPTETDEDIVFALGVLSTREWA